MRGQQSAGEGRASAPAMQAAARDVMGTADAARHIGVHPKTLARYAKDGLLPGTMLGGRWRFRRTVLDQWLTEQSRRGVRHG